MTATSPSPDRYPTPVSSLSPHPPVIALLTDFGLQDHFVGTMKAVIASIAPQTTVMDISHGVAPQDVRGGGFTLWASYRFFPVGTIFLAVVDPGVGSKRGIRVVWNERYIFIAPDNGLLDYVRSEEKDLRAVEVDTKDSRYTLAEISSTFHGRDIFSPLAAYLSQGVDPDSLGRSVDIGIIDSPFLSSTSKGEAFVVQVDHFGNCILNIRNSMLEKIASITTVQVTVSDVVRYYGEAPEATPCLIEGSNGLVEVFIKNGNAARTMGASGGSSVSVRWR